MTDDERSGSSGRTSLTLGATIAIGVAAGALIGLALRQGVR